jgi:hypothetical protein
MSRLPVLSGCLILAATALTHPLAAQYSDARWMEDCRTNTDRYRETYCDVKIYHLTSRTSLSIDAGMNGGVEVEAWDQPGIEVHARLQSSGRTIDDARAQAQQIDIDTAGTVLRASGPSMEREHGWSVSFLILVPRRMDIQATAHNGPVSVRNVSGRMDLDVVNGPLELDGLAGEVTARAENGPLDVGLAGTRWEGKGLDAETRNGPVTIHIPEGYSAELETGTINGPLDVEFPLTVTLQGRFPRRIKTTLGHGGSPVRAVTTNGPASIERGSRER